MTNPPDDIRSVEHQGTPLQTDGVPFEQAARSAMVALTGALSQLLSAIPEKVTRAVDVERALELDKKLAWQVFRLARAQSPTEVTKVPAARSVSRLLSQARKRKVDPAAIERVREAFEAFESFAHTQAGDREALASMVRSISDETDEQEEVRLRRSLFRGNAQVWGLRMRQFVRSTIYLPPTGPGARGEIMLSAHIDLEQIRPDSHAAIVSWARPSAAPGPAASVAAAIEPSFTLHEEFCSRPLPRMVQKPSVGAGVETELILGAVGRPGAATLYTTQALPLVKPETLARFETNNIFCIPVETVVFDLLIPAGWSDPATHRAACYGRRYHPEHVFERRPADLMPQRVSLTPLGEFRGRMPEVKGAPRHADAVAHILRQAGHEHAAFDVYRCVTRYPVLHTILSLGVDRASS